MLGGERTDLAGEGDDACQVISFSKAEAALAAFFLQAQAHLAELVDALDLGSSGFGRGGSSPPVGIQATSKFFAILAFDTERGQHLP